MANKQNLTTGASKKVSEEVSPYVGGMTISQAVLGGTMTQPDRNIQFTTKSTLQFPEDLPDQYMKLSLQNFVMSGLGFTTFLDGGTDIYLPMPKQIADQHNVGYKQESIGQVSGAAAQSATGVSEGALQNAFQSILGQAAGNFIKSFTGLDAPNAINAKAGLAPNQFLTVMLTGPQYKKHELSWTLSPRNIKESERIRRIIEQLNNAMAPGFDGGYFTHPMVVTPSFTNENVLYKFKPSVIETMSVNFTPSGSPSFYAVSKAPDSVEIRLSLLEIEFWLKGNFKMASISGADL